MSLSYNTILNKSIPNYTIMLQNKKIYSTRKENITNGELTYILHKEEFKKVEIKLVRT